MRRARLIADAICDSVLEKSNNYFGNMTTISSLDHSPFSLKNLVGDAELTAPVEGFGQTSLPRLFEGRSVRWLTG